jgi:hypothetical protein
VQSENLHRHHDHGRILHVGGASVVNRHLAVGDLDLGVADSQAVGIGLDGIGANRPCGERIAGGGRGRSGEEEPAARQGIDLMRQALQVGHQFRLSRHTKPPCVVLSGMLGTEDAPGM